MTQEERMKFAIEAKELVEQHQDIKYFSITVYKPRVEPHIREDSNKLYNYMIGLLLVEEMAKYNKIIFVPDYREIKVASGDSLHDHLVSKLWFEKGVKTLVINQPRDSASDKGVQFADMLSGLIQHHFEDNHCDIYPVLNHYINSKSLFF